MRAWAEKYLGFYKALFTVFLRGCRYVLSQYIKQTLFEKIFIIGLVAAILLLSAPWRSYVMQFPDQPAFVHGIFTDDFIWYFLADILLLLSLLHFDLSALRILRVSGLVISAIFLLLTLISPSRVAPTTEAVFTWQFYTFLVANVVMVITGIPGIVSYAQNSFRN